MSDRAPARSHFSESGNSVRPSVFSRFRSWSTYVARPGARPVLLLDLDDGVDFHSGAEGEGNNAEGGAGVFALVAKDADQEI